MQYSLMSRVNHQPESSGESKSGLECDGASTCKAREIRPT
jgi:hypothetical protein